MLYGHKINILQLTRQNHKWIQNITFPTEVRILWISEEVLGYWSPAFLSSSWTSLSHYYHRHVHHRLCIIIVMNIVVSLSSSWTSPSLYYHRYEHHRLIIVVMIIVSLSSSSSWTSPLHYYHRHEHHRLVIIVVMNFTVPLLTLLWILSSL